MKAPSKLKIALLVCRIRSTGFEMPQLKFSLAEIERFFAEDNRNKLYEISVDVGQKSASAGLILANFQDYLNKLESDFKQLEINTDEAREKVDLASQIIEEFGSFESEKRLLEDKIESCRANTVNYKLQMSPDNYAENKKLANDVRDLEARISREKQSLSELQSEQKLLKHQLVEKESLKKLKMGSYVPDLGDRIAAQALEMQRLREESQKESFALGVASKDCIEIKKMLRTASEANRMTRKEIQSLVGLVESMKHGEFPRLLAECGSKMDERAAFLRDTEAEIKKLLPLCTALADDGGAVKAGLRRILEHKADELAERNIKLSLVEDQIVFFSSQNAELSCQILQLDKETREIRDSIEKRNMESEPALYEVRLKIHRCCLGVIEELSKARELEDKISRVKYESVMREHILMALFIILSVVCYAVYILINVL